MKMKQPEDNDLRTALHRLEVSRTAPEVPADFCDRVMAQVSAAPRVPVARAVARRRRLWWAVAGMAASILLAVVLMWPSRSEGPAQAAIAETMKVDKGAATGMAEAQRENNDATAVTAEVLKADKARGRKKVPVNSSKADSPKESTARELPDTLGQGIWESEENVVLALQLLSECEETIERSEQRLRNGIVEATFTALPQRPQASLVVYDNGDYMVVDDSQPSVIEL